MFAALAKKKHRRGWSIPPLRDRPRAEKYFARPGSVSRAWTQDVESGGVAGNRAFAHDIAKRDFGKRCALGRPPPGLDLLCLGGIRGSAQFCPSCCARLWPPVRMRISSRSNSARPPETGNSNRPCAVIVSAIVSAHAAPSEWKRAFFSVIAAGVFSSSGRARVAVDPRHDHHVPAASAGTSRCSCGRLVLAPLATARNTLLAQAARSCRPQAACPPP
jgi:hypothetical protein